jgi:hypothetical protein
MGNENPERTLNMLRMGGVPDVKLLAVTARVRWTVVGQPLQFIEYITMLFRGSDHRKERVVYSINCFYSHVAQW